VAKVIWRGPMYHGTDKLHHVIETDTMLGQIMKDGTPGPEEFVGWLSFKAQFFDTIERHIPPASRRADAYRRDIAAMGLPERQLRGAVEHAAWVAEPGLSEPERERRLTGTAYVCVGSVFGAEEIRRRLAAAGKTYPVSSLTFQDQATEIAYLRQLRHRGDCIYEAMLTFARMADCCDEITGATK
jgi:hypothetical protein